MPMNLHASRLFLVGGVLLYGGLMAWIIIPSGPLSCQTQEPSQLSQPNITLGAWEAQFISERFCQCYESENAFLRALPLLAAACMIAVLLVIDQLDAEYRTSLKKKIETSHQKTFNIFCYHVNLHKISKPIRHAMVVIAMTSYICLTLFTHRRVYGFRPFDLNMASGTLHYFFTSLFFATFTLLYMSVVWDHALLTEEGTVVAWFHIVTLFGIFVLSFLFAFFSIIFIQDEVAILIEYILFGWITLAVPIWIGMLLWHQEDDNSAHQIPLAEGAGAEGDLFQKGPEKMSIYDLNLDIL